MRYLVDTTVISELTRREPDVRVMAWLREHEDLWTTSVVVGELLFGLARLPAGRRRDALEAAVLAILAERFHDRVLPFDEHAAVEYAAVRHQQEAAGRPSGDLDAIIAAVARSCDAVVATRNMRHFADAGVETVDPWRDPASRVTG
ncbi:type II toxin-antitoxin system VapC family toxin [Isoptericola halotolerans]|uniref:type II toxin-antitoxin system VapC family toxin n=1 Tax=Isoptericola halotolerans TaxID=300560 RepID=UPI0038905150